MIKLVHCITRKPGPSDEEFFRYWKDVHGPIGRRIPGLRRLIQSHTLAESRTIRPPDFDGMAELWFDDLDSLRAAMHSPEWQASSRDERNFIDGSRTAAFITEEHEIVGAEP